jgi:hypothetical protein
MASFSSSRALPLKYSAAAQFMHWFVAVEVIALLAIGPVMKRLVPEGSLRDNLYNLHEACPDCHGGEARQARGPRRASPRCVHVAR